MAGGIDLARLRDPLLRPIAEKVTACERHLTYSFKGHAILQDRCEIVRPECSLGRDCFSRLVGQPAPLRLNARRKVKLLRRSMRAAPTSAAASY